MPKVLLIDSLYHADGEDLLRRHATVQLIEDGSRETIFPVAADCDAIIVRTPATVSAELIRRAPRLQVISTSGIGTDNVDVQAATEAGVVVVNQPGANEIAVVEHTLLLMLALAKRLFWSDHVVRSGESWEFRSSSPCGELYDKTLGILGVGRIGRRVAALCRGGFGMRVLGYDPYVPRAAIEAAGAEPVDRLEDLLPRVDILSLHCVLTPATHRLLDADRLALLQPGALVVNTARGGLVDGHALARALSEGRLAGAGLDVHESEPPDPSDPLLRSENVILTPHTAGVTRESGRRMALSAVSQVLDVLAGRRPAHPVNPDIWDRRRRPASASVAEAAGSDAVG